METQDGKTEPTRRPIAMSQLDRERLRQTFGEAAELYDRSRPSYPRELIDALVELTEIGPGSKVLEIGCGSGQLTVPLAGCGCKIMALELGAEMAAVARRKLAHFPRVHVIVSSFEDWPLPPEPFDAVVCATAFHWLDPAVRVSKSAAALRPGGSLATIATHHVAGGTNGFFAESQACYERWDPTTVRGFRMPSARDIPMDSEEIVRSAHFGPVTFRRFEWERAYTTTEYLDLLLTYSGHRTLPPEHLRHLLDCIAGLIDTRYDGQIVKHYLFELRVATLTPHIP